MSVHAENMSGVGAADEQVPEGQYHFRISKVDEKFNDAGEELISVQCKIQTEGPNFGETVFINASLAGFGLRVLKSLYKATGYNPGLEGHDPERLLDGEFLGTVVHKVYQGNTYANIAPPSIKPLV